ncbi:MAG: ATPase, T2SS/T4P/T4SS family [Candidatus ainarchaeum sp.]|nr:ATPase, T2SS/T4P/T4SS family [Candidatus ainarchaeum sp.]
MSEHTIEQDYPFKIYKVSNKEEIYSFIKKIKDLSKKGDSFLKEALSKLDFVMSNSTFPNKIEQDDLNTTVKELLSKSGMGSIKQPEAISLYLSGYGGLSFFFDNDEIEEIMVNKTDSPIFIFHKKEGLCKTNINFTKEEYLTFLNKLQNLTSKKLDEHNPVLDGRLPDGSRINITSNYVTPFSPTITIRKFTEKPLSIVSLIKNNTISKEAAAFLWVCIDGFRLCPQSTLVIGGSGSGKTTLLFALTSFIRYNERIVSIEDTPELNLSDRENWISLEARPKTSTVEEVTMDMLLKNSLRMRPDRIIVGEVRGEEARTMFTAMDTGHNGLLGTLHANNSKEAIIRLKSEPMSIPESNLPLLNLIVTIKKQFDTKKGITRFVSEIAEIERMDNKVLLSNVFEYDKDDDKANRSSVPSRTLENVAKAMGVEKVKIYDEIELREKILEFLLNKGIEEYKEITQYIQKYYEDPEELINKLYSEKKGK